MLPAKLNDRHGKLYWLALSTPDDAEVMHTLRQEVAQTGVGYPVNSELTLERASTLVSGKVANVFCLSIKEGSKDGKAVGFFTITPCEFTRSFEPLWCSIAGILDKEHRNIGLLTSCMLPVAYICVIIGFKGVISKILLHNIPSVQLSLANTNQGMALGVVPYAVFVKNYGWVDKLLTYNIFSDQKQAKI